MTLLTLLSASPDVPVGDVPASGSGGSSRDVKTTSFSVVMTPSETSLTLVAGIDYTIQPGLKSDQIHWFINSTRHGGMGTNVGGGNQEPRDHGVVFADTSDGLTQLVLSRSSVSGSDACRVTITIWCAVRPASKSAFRVRQRGVLTFGGSEVTKLASSSAGATINGQCWVCITGQGTETTSRGRAHYGSFTAKLLSGTVQARRGVGPGVSGQDDRLSYAVVEFAEDWDVQRVEFTSPDDAVNVWRGPPNHELNIPVTISSEGGTAVADIARTFIDPQFRNSVAGNQGNDDQGEVVELTGVDTLTVRKSTNSDFASKDHLVWIIEDISTSPTLPAVVQHLSEYVDSGAEGAEEGVTSRTVTDLGDLLSTTVIGGSCSADGTTNRTPRGRVDLLHSSAVVVTETRSETGSAERRAYCQMRFPSGERPSVVGSRAGAATVGAVEGGAATLSSRGGAAALGAVEGGAATITARGGAATLGAVEGGAC